VRTKKVTLLGQKYNTGVADAGTSTVATLTIEVPLDMTFAAFVDSHIYKARSKKLLKHPSGVDYVAVKSGTTWPMPSISSSSVNDAGERHA
jgi:hypothetical protein